MGKIEFDATAWNVGNHYSTQLIDLLHQLLDVMYLMNWMFQIENAVSVVWMYAYPTVNGSTLMNRSKLFFPILE